MLFLIVEIMGILESICFTLLTKFALNLENTMQAADAFKLVIQEVYCT